MLRRFHWRFTLRTLLLLTAVLGVSLGVYIDRARVQVRGMLRVQFPQPGFRSPRPPHSADHDDEFRLWLLHSLNSEAVIQEILADPKVASLPILEGESDPAAWISERLEISNPHDAQILCVTFNLKKYWEDPHQGADLVDGILNHCAKHWNRPGLQSPLEPAPFVTVIEGAQILKSRW